jgi:hypothetical protein
MQGPTIAPYSQQLMSFKRLNKKTIALGILNNLAWCIINEQHLRFFSIE